MTDLTLTEFTSGGKVKAQEINDNFTTLKDAVELKVDSSDTSVTKQGNTFNGANQLVKINEDGKLPVVDGSNLINVGGYLKLNQLGNVTSNVNLPVNHMTAACVSAPLAIVLPTSFMEGVENTVVFDFTTYNSSQPTIETTGTLKWSDKNGGKPPVSYSALSAVKNRLTFTTTDGGTTWEAEYKTFGAAELTFTRPNLSTNGSMGGSSFAVASNIFTSNIYLLFDGNSSTALETGAVVSGINIDIYNPQALKIPQLGILNWQGVHAPASGNVYGSNDYSNWTLLKPYTNNNGTDSGTWYINIDSVNQNFYKYYRLNIASTISNQYFNCREIYVNNATYIATS